MILALVLCSALGQGKPAAVVDAWLTSHIGTTMGKLPEPTEIHGLERLAGGSFLAVHFREYPLAQASPAPLSSRNIVFVSKGVATPYSSRKAFDDAFPSLLSAPISRNQILTVLHGYLDLSKEFSQDGYYRFFVALPRMSVTQTDAGLEARGAATVEQKGGNRGELDATLDFTKSGDGYKLDKITEQDTIRPGIRPL